MHPAVQSSKNRFGSLSQRWNILFELIALTPIAMVLVPRYDRDLSAGERYTWSVHCFPRFYSTVCRSATRLILGEKAHQTPVDRRTFNT